MIDEVVDIQLKWGAVSTNGKQDSGLPFDRFFLGPENKLAQVAVASVMEQHADCYSPLVIYGASGVGKSHLAHGLANYWKQRNCRHRVVIVTAVDFAHELAEAIESQAVDEFRAKYRQADFFVLEDLGQLVTERSEKLNAQEELIYTLDSLTSAGRCVLITATKSPAEIEGLLPALRSRLLSGLVVELLAPSTHTRLALLRHIAAYEQFNLSDEVAVTLAETMPSTVPEFIGNIRTLLASSSLEDVKIDIKSIKQLVAKNGNRPLPKMHDIALATARHFSVRLSDLRSPNRSRALVRARGVAIYLARQFGKQSLQEIGKYLGGRDHTTIMHSYQRIAELLETDPVIHSAVEVLYKELWKK